MRVWLIMIVVAGCTCSAAKAQQVLKGIVLEINGNAPIQEAAVKNLETGLQVKTNEDGSFAIAVKKNERLTFEQFGYRKDTLLVTEFEFKRVYLSDETTSIQLNEVQVRAMTDNQLQREIREAEVQGKVTGNVRGGGLAISPSRWFGRDGKEARRKYRMLKAEEENRMVDRRFNKELISQFIPLKGNDLENFMKEYRPDIDFVTTADEEKLRLYIIDSYARFKAGR